MQWSTPGGALPAMTYPSGVPQRPPSRTGVPQEGEGVSLCIGVPQLRRDLVMPFSRAVAWPRSAVPCALVSRCRTMAERPCTALYGRPLEYPSTGVRMVVDIHPMHGYVPCIITLMHGRSPGRSRTGIGGPSGGPTGVPQLQGDRARAQSQARNADAHPRAIADAPARSIE